MSSVNSLNDKIAVVTGASRGIGAAIALELAVAGATVLGTATTAMGAAKITAYLKEKGYAGEGRVLDIADHQQIDSFFEDLQKEGKTVGILVNNAGITSDNLMLRMKKEEWLKVIQTNLNGAFHLIQAALRPMIKMRWGRIVNITSIVGVTGNAGQANYAAAKAGLIGLTKSVALEVGSRGITVNAVAPGFIDTDMTRALTQEQREKILEGVPLSRAGETTEIAQAVRFLVTEGAYITGETLHVNGGMLMV